MIHELKTYSRFFNAIVSGEKTFEVRKNDKHFQKGDLLALNEYDAARDCHTGRSCLLYIDYILNDSDYCKTGYVIMSVKPCAVRRFGKPDDPCTCAEDYGVPLATRGEE